MNVEFLHSFVSVVEAGSIAEAARRLDLSPAAVSARLQALEDELGAPLIQRAGRSVRPTDAGMRILERSRTLLREVRDLRAIVSEKSLTGELRLGVFVTGLISMVPAVLQRLYAAYPELSVFVAPGTSVQLCSRVASGELDAAFVVEPQFALPKNCDWQPLLGEPLVVLAHASMASRDPLGLLASEPFIRYHRGSLGGQMADRYLRDRGIRPRQRLEIDSLLAIASLVDHQLGVSLLPGWLCRSTGHLDVIPLSLPSPPLHRIGLMHGLQGPCVPLAQALLTEARAVFNGQGKS